MYFLNPVLEWLWYEVVVHDKKALEQGVVLSRLFVQAVCNSII